MFTGTLPRAVESIEYFTFWRALSNSDISEFCVGSLTLVVSKASDERFDHGMQPAFASMSSFMKFWLRPESLRARFRR